MEMIININKLDLESATRIRDLGFISLTTDAKDLLDANEVELTELFKRYANGDYGESDDAFRNDLALYSHFGQCRGVYTLSDGQKVVITTKFNQAVTHIQDVCEVEP